ncbi:DUF2509 family protein [Rosenbergiella australiborealis]|uniref:DUF2509 family protein n=1 Tax=Rosenbergiella australiborealis TaxID=1544696 RepID=UPI001F4EA1F2|nr:DUF2509 family protein [Rosenbergiella australiborealis]
MWRPLSSFERFTQQGNTTLLCVLMVMTLASSLLRLKSSSIHYGTQQVNDEKKYLTAFYQAQSALAWGGSYEWSMHLGWQCRASPSSSFSVCLWRATPTEGWLRGSSEKSEWLLWQRVIFPKTSPSRSQRHRRGWIDDCPLSVEQCLER